MIQDSVSCQDPVIFFEPNGATGKRARSTRPRAGPRLSSFSTVLRRGGNQATLVGYGATMPVVLAAAEAAAAEGRSLEVFDLRTLSPLDLDPVVESVRRTGHCVVVAEAPREASLASDVAARITEEAFYSLAPRLPDFPHSVE